MAVWHMTEEEARADAERERAKYRQAMERAMTMTQTAQLQPIGSQPIGSLSSGANIEQLTYYTLPTPPSTMTVITVGTVNYEVPKGIAIWIYSFQERLTRRLFWEALRDELRLKAIDVAGARGISSQAARKVVIDIAMGLKKHEPILKECRERARQLFIALYPEDGEE